MAEYRNRTSGEVKTESELRAANKNMSFPKAWNSSVHDALNVDPVLASPAPKPSAEFKVLVRDGVVQDGKGNWVYAWKEQEMFTEYTDDDGNTVTVQAQKDAKASADNAALAAEERSKRNDLLKATDHYGLSDVTMTDDWRTYRQALRDLPAATAEPQLDEQGNLTNVTWPTKPE